MYEKNCELLREHAMKIINLKKNVINKRTTGIIWKCRNLSHFKGKIANKYVKDKKYCKVRHHYIIAIMQTNIEVLRIAYLKENIVYLKKFP